MSPLRLQEQYTIILEYPPACRSRLDGASSSSSPNMTASHSATAVALPPSQSALLMRGMVASAVAAEFIIHASGLSLMELSSRYYLSSSPLLRWQKRYLYGAVDPQHAIAPEVLWLCRLAVVAFVLAAAYNQVKLAALNRPVPIVLAVNTRRAVTVGWWRPEFFWPLIVLELGGLSLLWMWGDEGGALSKNVYVCWCVFLILLGRNIADRDVEAGRWDGDGTGKEWKDHFWSRILRLVIRAVSLEFLWAAPKNKSRRRHR